MKPIYLDYNATTPIAEEVADAMRPFLDEHFGNPSSSHAYGSKSKSAVENARSQVARLINCDPSEIVFTSGGTESNNYALKGLALTNESKGKHIITSTIEHPAILEVSKYLEEQGFFVSYLPVDRYGMIQLDELKKEIREDTILISIMLANNEVGTIQSIPEIANIAKDSKIVLHTDAAQSLGKIPVDVNNLGVDLLSIAGHKLYAPKGIGALYIKNGLKLEKLIHGADHELNRRAGTENVLGIVGLGAACELAHKELNKNIEFYSKCRNFLQEQLLKEFPAAVINGHPDRRLPNTLSISFPNINASALVSKLEYTAVSAGAACHSEKIKISNVLKAMDIPREVAMGTIRISTGKNNSLIEMKSAANEIISTVKILLSEHTNTNVM